MSVTLRQLAELVEGQLYGDGDLTVAAARPLHSAEPGDITFVENERQAGNLKNSRASAAVVPTSFTGNGLPLIRVADPLAAFVAIVRHMRGLSDPPPIGIDPRACVDPTARLGADVSVYPFAVIGEGSVLGDRCRIHSGVVIGRFCRLGNDVVLHPNVVLYDGTILADRVIVQANAVLGADGFGYRFQQGRHVKVPQLGHVEVGADVEIGACSTIDRATFEVTTIGEGSKIDNLVQIAHNCQIGRHNVFASQVGIAGSSSTGDYVVLGGQVGIADHVHIGEGTMIGGQSGISGDVPPGQRLLGTPALPERNQKRVMVTMMHLPEMRRDIRRIKQHLGMNDDD